MDMNEYIRADIESVRRLANGDPDARHIYDRSESQPSRAFMRGPSRTPARGRRGAAR